MNRRNFIISSSLTAISLTTFGSIIKQSNGTFIGDCDTTDDILGPKYRPGAPVRSNLLFSGLEGTQVNIKGKVFTDDCKTAIAGASVELWHCNDKGDYDDTSDKFLHRATWITDKNGDYSFLTIVPGKYLNGNLYRPAHFHFRVKATNHKELISQVYFQGDPYIKTDRWASSQKAKERILEIKPKTNQAEASILFNIHLQKA